MIMLADPCMDAAIPYSQNYFEGSNFRGFRGFFVNLENFILKIFYSYIKYYSSSTDTGTDPCNHIISYVQNVIIVRIYIWGIRKYF